MRRVSAASRRDGPRTQAKQVTARPATSAPDPIGSKFDEGAPSQYSLEVPPAWHATTPPGDCQRLEWSFPPGTARQASQNGKAETHMQLKLPVQGVVDRAA